MEPLRHLKPSTSCWMMNHGKMASSCVRGSWGWMSGEGSSPRGWLGSQKQHCSPCLCCRCPSVQLLKSLLACWNSPLWWSMSDHYIPFPYLVQAARVGTVWAEMPAWWEGPVGPAVGKGEATDALALPFLLPFCFPAAVWGVGELRSVL